MLNLIVNINSIHGRKSVGGEVYRNPGMLYVGESKLLLLYTLYSEEDLDFLRL